MISDVLSDALVWIEEYEKDMPEVYTLLRDEIKRVKDVMRELQRGLDTPPVHMSS